MPISIHLDTLGLKSLAPKEKKRDKEKGGRWTLALLQLLVATDIRTSAHSIHLATQTLCYLLRKAHTFTCCEARADRDIVPRLKT